MNYYTNAIIKTLINVYRSYTLHTSDYITYNILDATLAAAIGWRNTALWPLFYDYIIS